MLIEKKEVSIIVPSYNGEKKLPIILDSLQNQTFKEFELIIVIDGSSDNSEKVINKYLSVFVDCKIIRQKNKGRARTRNEGAKYASGELLIFYDDDILLSKSSIQQHIDRFKNQQKKTIIVGNVEEDPSLATSEFEKYRCFLRKNWLKHYSDNGVLLTKRNLYLTAANFSISKQLFEELNGFDESFADAEDFELAIRAYKKGVDVFFDKNNIAIHHDEATVESYINRRGQYEKARKQLHQKHPDFITTFHKSFLRSVIYCFFSFRFWVKAIEKEYLTFLPRSLRYRIYTLIIWGLSQYFPNKKL